MLTCTNKDFTTGVKAELNKWESGSNITFDEIKADSIVKYNNICERLKKKNRTFDGKIVHNAAEKISAPVNTDRTKIFALTTQLEEAKKQLIQAYATNAQTANKSQGEQNTPLNSTGRKPNVKSWRMRKTFRDKVERDGKVYFWCPHHKYPGFYNGLYVTHPPHQHDEWKDRQDRMKKRGKYAGLMNTGAQHPSSPEPRAVLNDKLQAVLMISHGFSQLQLDQLMKDAGDSGN